MDNKETSPDQVPTQDGKAGGSPYHPVPEVRDGIEHGRLNGKAGGEQGPDAARGPARAATRFADNIDANLLTITEYR